MVKSGGKRPPEGKPDERLKKACADFEGIFLNFMLQTMKKTLPGDAIFGKSHQREIYDTLFYQEISSKLARERGMGIGDALYRQLRRQGDREDQDSAENGKGVRFSLPLKNPIYLKGGP
jgi:flagellar protein FlgJ